MVHGEDISRPAEDVCILPHTEPPWGCPVVYSSWSKYLNNGAALAIEEHCLLSSRCCRSTSWSPPALTVFLGSFFCRLFCGMGSRLLAFLNNHSRIGNLSTSILLRGNAAVARIPVLNRLRWRPKCPLLRGSSADSSLFFLGFCPPFIAFILAGESSFVSVSACLSSKIHFLVLVVSPSLGPPGKVAGGVAVIFEWWGGCCYPPNLLKNYC